MRLDPFFQREIQEFGNEERDGGVGGYKNAKEYEITVGCNKGYSKISTKNELVASVKCYTTTSCKV